MLKFILEIKNIIIMTKKYFIRLKSGYLYNFRAYRNLKLRKIQYDKKKKVKKTKGGWLYKTMPATKKVLMIEIQDKPRARYTKVEIFMKTIKDMNIDLRKKKSD